MTQTTGQLWPPGAEFVEAVAPAAASVRAISYANYGGAGVFSLPTTFPAGTTSGDKLVLMMMLADTNLGSPVTESITGWTAVTPKGDQGTCTRALYQATYTAGLAAPSWASTAEREGVWAMVAIRDSTTALTINATDLSASATTIVAPGQSDGGPDVLLRFYCRKDNLSTAITPPSGTVLVSALGSGTGPNAHLLVVSQTPTGDPIPTATATFTASSANGTGWTVSG
jgi:hypothetical protein